MTETDRYIGAIDQGTSSTKFIVLDRSGRIVGDASAEHETMNPRSTWSEQDPVEIWDSAVQAIKTALDESGLDPTSISALGVANQRETTVVWDRETGDPVYNAIVWQDQRTSERVNELKERGMGDYIRETTGLEPDPYLSAGKVEWILDTQDLRERARRGEIAFGTIDSWLLYNLTGEHATDVTNASRTMLFDIHDTEWDDRLVEEFGIPKAMLPTVRPSIVDQPYGKTAPDGVFDRAVPVTGVLGDQQSALVGHAGFQPGDVKHTIGTTSVMITNVGTDAENRINGMNLTIGYQLSGEEPVYALEGLTWSGGQVIDWLSKTGVIDSPEETEALARSVDSTDGVYFVSTFNGLGSPFWRADATGTIVGLTPGTGREELVRAALEGIAFRATDVTSAMTHDADLELERLMIDGGMAQNDFLCQRLADFTGVVVDRPVVQETTALGAAYAAGLGIGYWSDTEALEEYPRIDAEFSPTISRDDARTLYQGWKKALAKSYD